MTDKEIIAFALNFRKGLIGRSPSAGKCAKVSLPLLVLLMLHGIAGEIESGKVYIENERTSFDMSHVFIRLADDRILDATADQFKTPTGRAMPKVYLGPCPPWYEPA